MAVTILTVLGLMFALTATVQYYDVVCYGELKLWHRWTQYLCCGCLNKVNEGDSFGHHSQKVYTFDEQYPESYEGDFRANTLPQRVHPSSGYIPI
jgi:hypothetical protein